MGKVIQFNIFIFVFATFANFHNISAKWKQVYNKSGIKVYKKQNKSDLVQFKGTAVVSDHISLIAVTVLDIGRYKEWLPNILEFTRLEKISKFHFINYTSYDMPWPVKNRDIVTDSKIIIDKKGKWFHVKFRETSHKKRPVTKSFLRIPKSRGSWSLTPLKSGKGTWIEFYAQGDPGGNIPTWFINWVGKYQLADGIRGVRKQIKKKKISPEIFKEIKVMKNW